MRWFDPMPGDAEDAEDEFRSALVSVLAATTGRPVGGGLCLGGRYVLTCAHVVNAAHGLDTMERTEPVGAAVDVRFHGGAHPSAVRGRAALAEWIPPTRPDGSAVRTTDTSWEGDLAVLVLDADPPPTVRAPQWRDLVPGQRLRAWLGDGLAISAVDGTVKMLVHEGTYLESDPTPRAIGLGYSGGPLWSRADRAATGLVAGALSHKGEGLTFVIPWQKIARQCRLLRDLPPTGPKAPELDQDEVGQLADTLDTVLRSDGLRALAARSVCEKLGLTSGHQGTAPSVDEFAAALLGRPRAAALLVEYLLEQGHEQEAGHLLDGLHEVVTPGLLTPKLHRDLIRVLEKLHAELPDAVPPDHLLLDRIAELPPDRGPAEGRHLRTVEALETLRARPGRVVQLLRYVERLAAALDRQPGAQPYPQRLRDWSDRAAGKLAVSRGGLLEHRDLAEQWAATAVRTGSVRVVLRLNRVERDRTGAPGRVQRALWADRGDGRLAPAGPNDDRPVSPAQVAAEVLDLYGELGLDHDTDPHLEVFLEEKDLRLPVEEWTDEPPEGVLDILGRPQPLGAHLPVVVRLAGNQHFSPARLKRRKHEIKHRWQAGTVAEPLYLGENVTEADQAVTAALGNRHAGWAVIRGGTADRRTALAVACLGFGIPVVLWDRSTTGAPPDELFGRLVGRRASADAPEELRKYRAQAHGSRDRYPLRPVLAWEHPDRPEAPPLPLTDPDDHPRPHHRPGRQEDAP